MLSYSEEICLNAYEITLSPFDAIYSETT